MRYEVLRIEDILHDYERTRLVNKRILQERREEIYKKIPRIHDIDQEISSSSLNAAKLRIMGRDTDKSQSEDTKAKNRKLTSEKQDLLTAAGFPADYLEPIYQCFKCKDTGYCDQEKCSCFVNHIIERLYLQSNLNNILSKENFSTFSLDYYSREIPEGRPCSPYDNIKNILEASKKFIQKFETQSTGRGNLLIYGETGLGKTFLSNCIAKELLDKGHTVLYLSSNELFESVLSEFIMNHNRQVAPLYQYVDECELLIIDDLGTELTNSFVASQLFEIINKRQLAGLSTLISTNLGMIEIRDKYSERIMSRIIADYTVFNIYGDNIRYQKRKKAIHSTT